MDTHILIKQGWTIASDQTSAHQTFRFTNFASAVGWMASLVEQIDTLNHHPEWHNVYNRVDVRLTTHDAGTLTDLDERLANLLDQSFELRPR
jgi:4a-hydroxytetrahydrobiopterin dehydratase